MICSQIDVKVLDPNLQKMCFENLQPKIQDKITMMKFPTFLHLCTSLCDYQNLVSSHEVKPTSSQHEKFKATNQGNYQPFKRKNKGFLQINPPQQPNQPINNLVAILKIVIPYTYEDSKRKFTPLLDTLEDTIMELI